MTVPLLGPRWTFWKGVMIGSLLGVVGLLVPFVLLPEALLSHSVTLQDAAASSSNCRRQMWSESQIISYMQKHPQRAYFSRLFRDGGFRVGMEVGVAGGRFSEHFLIDNKGLPHWTWYMVEPYPNDSFRTAAGIHENTGVSDPSDPNGSWNKLGLVGSLNSNVHTIFIKELSTDPRLVRDIPDGSLDFIYLDGAHDYKNVLLELPLYWKKVKKGGVLAGHDYCNFGDPTGFSCRGCDNVPRCPYEYTEKGAGKKGAPTNQHGVVTAVHEWLASVEKDDPLHAPARLYHTEENFTRKSLETDGMDYDLILTSTRNPSWYFVKSLSG